jgi:hypothetical protein
MRTHSRWALGLGIGLAAIAACGLDPAEPGEAPLVEDWPLVECDELVPGKCGFPFPSNVYTVADSSTATGRRVSLSDAMMPANYYDVAAMPDPWNGLDGFSTGITPMAHFPGLSPEALIESGTARADSIERSLQPDTKTLLIDAETGELVPHWAEIDETTDDDATRAILLRPAVRLKDAHRYIVAMRGLVGDDGELLPVSDLFAELRDSDDPQTERRAVYDNIFHYTSALGVDRDELQLAWDYTTSSRDNNTAWMVHMRDQAFALVGEQGPEYTITSVEDDYEPEHIAYRVNGTMRVPMYLDQPGAGAQLLIGADGLPTQNPDLPWADFEFEVLIPHSATTTPAPLMQYGHGLLGEKEQIESGHFLTFIDEYNYVIFAVDFIGFAADDELHVGAIIDSGRFEDFDTVVDRQHQGMLNSLLAMRMMKARFANDPMFGSMIDGSSAYYHGISQGGIFGGTYMGLSTDVERGALGVMGMPYSLLLFRSVDFDQFFDIIKAGYSDGRDVQLLISLAQMLWDKTEPNGYVPYIRDNMLPGTPSHEVLMRAAIGDHQVTTLGAHVMVRTLGIPMLDQGLREVHGIETVTDPVMGSAYVEYDFGLPSDPVGNTPQRECEDPHGKLRKLDPARKQLDTFLRQGRVESFCDGACIFADMSGCP